MLTTVQPSRAPTSVIGSGSAKVSARAHVGELALGVVVVDQQRQGRPVRRPRPTPASPGRRPELPAARIGRRPSWVWMLLTLAAPSLAAPTRRPVRRSAGRRRLAAAVLVADQRPDHRLGRHAVQLAG